MPADSTAIGSICNLECIFFFAAGSQVSLHIGVLWQTLPAHTFDYNTLRRSVNPHENIEDLQHKKHDAHLTEIMNRPSKYAKTEGQADCIVNSLACLVVTLWVHFLSPRCPQIRRTDESALCWRLWELPMLGLPPKLLSTTGHRPYLLNALLTRFALGGGA